MIAHTAQVSDGTKNIAKHFALDRKTEHPFISSDENGRVRIAPEDIEAIANLVVKKLKSVNE